MNGRIRVIVERGKKKRAFTGHLNLSIPGSRFSSDYIFRLQFDSLGVKSSFELTQAKPSRVIYAWSDDFASSDREYRAGMNMEVVLSMCKAIDSSVDRLKRWKKPKVSVNCTLEGTEITSVVGSWRRV